MSSGTVNADTDAAQRCKHRERKWHRSKWEPDGRHGPVITVTVAGETLHRLWTTCGKCEVRLETARVVEPYGAGAR